MGLIFDGVDFEITYGVVVSGAGTWAKPERDRELVHIPGRNGDLIYDNGCWHNIEIPYSFYFREGWRYKYEEFCEWLCSHLGYFRLEDPDRHPGVYRMAEFAGPLDPKKWLLSDDGTVTITFNCKPQQWLLDGETETQFEILPSVDGYLYGDLNSASWADDDSGMAVATALIAYGDYDPGNIGLRVKNNGDAQVELSLGVAAYNADLEIDNGTVLPAELSPGYETGISISGAQNQPYLRFSVFCLSGLENLEVYLEYNDERIYTISINPTVVDNPTPYNSQPILTLDSSLPVTFDFNDFTISYPAYPSSGIVVDCDLEECYMNVFSGGTESVNSLVTITNSNIKELHDFPYLKPGENKIGNFRTSKTIVVGLENMGKSVIMKPNWFRI